MTVLKRLFLIALLLCSPQLFADELSQAYQKEYAYLLSEKDAIAQRLGVLERQHEQTLGKLRGEINALERQYLTGQNETDRLNLQITEAGRAADSGETDEQLLSITLQQARESLQSLDQQIDETRSGSAQLASAFSLASRQVQQDSAVKVSNAQYFDLSGSAVDGQVMSIGRIARYGLAANASGPLHPSGNGMFSLWEQHNDAATQELAEGNARESLALFLFDDITKAIEKRDDKTLMDDVKAGGIVGKVILVIGLLGAALVILRSLFLLSFSANVQKLSRDVDTAMQDDNRNKLLVAFEKGRGSAHRVIAQTLKNLDKDRDHIEDIVSESILHERSKIDRFGTLILVLAAISPLLGLLGTVTGMMTTFDIITEFGTGDPKLLSSGISEALVTTKFGLVVAIPLLLLGNVLTSWGNRIKTELEQVALHVINAHKA